LVARICILPESAAHLGYIFAKNIRIALYLEILIDYIKIKTKTKDNRAVLYFVIPKLIKNIINTF